MGGEMLERDRLHLKMKDCKPHVRLSLCAFSPQLEIFQKKKREEKQGRREQYKKCKKREKINEEEIYKLNHSRGAQTESIMYSAPLCTFVLQKTSTFSPIKG